MAQTAEYGCASDTGDEICRQGVPHTHRTCCARVRVPCLFTDAAPFCVGHHAHSVLWPRADPLAPHACSRVCLCVHRGEGLPDTPEVKSLQQQLARIKAELDTTRRDSSATVAQLQGQVGLGRALCTYIDRSVTGQGCL